MDLLGSLGSHFQLLGALFAQEGREAGGRLIRALACLVAALLFAALGYIFLLLGAAFVLAVWFHWSWIWIALGIGVIHAAAAALLTRQMLRYFQSPVFPSLRAEIRRDLEQLQPNVPAHGQNPLA